MRRKGGRPKGCRGHKNNGLFKKCEHRRRDWPTCGDPWYMNFAHKGQSHRINLYKYADKARGYEMPKTEAETLRDRIRAEIREGTFQSSGTDSTPANGRTLDDVAPLFLEWWAAQRERRPHRVEALKGVLDLICRTQIEGPRGTLIRMGDKPLREFETPDLEAFRAARRRIQQEADRKRRERAEKIATGDAEARRLPVSTETPRHRGGEIGTNRNLEVLRHLFNWAIETGHFKGENPFLRFGRRVVKFATEKARERRLEGDEEARLLKHAEPHLAACIICAIDTGLRHGEITHLQWKDVLTDRAGRPKAFFIRGEHSKTGKSRTVPIASQRLFAVLEMRKLGPDGQEHKPDAFVFGNEVGEQVDSIKTAWNGTCRRAGISGLNFHDLRREHGSRMLEGGVNLLTVSRLLGHAKVSTTDTYLKASDRLADKEVREWHRKHGKLYPGFTPDAKTERPVAGKARVRKSQKRADSLRIS